MLAHQASKIWKIVAQTGLTVPKKHQASVNVEACRVHVVLSGSFMSPINETGPTITRSPVMNTVSNVESQVFTSNIPMPGPGLEHRTLSCKADVLTTIQLRLICNVHIICLNLKWHLSLYVLWCALQNKLYNNKMWLQTDSQINCQHT